MTDLYIYVIGMSIGDSACSYLERLHIGRHLRLIFRVQIASVGVCLIVQNMSFAAGHIGDCHDAVPKIASIV